MNQALSLWMVIYIGACLALAFCMFCRLRLTTRETRLSVRWSLVAVFALSLAAAIAPFIWREHWPYIQTMLLVAVAIKHATFSGAWAKNQAPKGLT
jgi:hypothetical protein